MDIDSGLFVQQGDVRHPETASRYNAVNEMLGYLGSSRGGSCERLRNFSPETICGMNQEDTAIPAGSYVMILPLDKNKKLLFHDTYLIKPGIMDPCGVTLADCPPGETVEVQVSGLVAARKTAVPPGVMKITGYPFDNMELVNINSPGNDLYRNYFKVSAVEFSGDGTISKVRIYDGGNPDSSSAGETDIGSVSCGELEYSFHAGTKIYLCLKEYNDGENQFDFNHVFEINITESSDKPSICLAEISPSNTVIQRWTGGTVYWRNRFILPFIRGR